MFHFNSSNISISSIVSMENDRSSAANALSGVCRYGGAPPSSVRWMFGFFRMSYFSSITGFSPRMSTMASLLSSRRTSSGARSSLPQCQVVNSNQDNKNSPSPFKRKAISYLFYISRYLAKKVVGDFQFLGIMFSTYYIATINFTK